MAIIVSRDIQIILQCCILLGFVGKDTLLEIFNDRFSDFCRFLWR